jgi:hypothetical protein
MSLHILTIHPKREQTILIEKFMAEALRGHSGSFTHAITPEDALSCITNMKPSMIFCAMEWREQIADMMSMVPSPTPFILIGIEEGQFSTIMSMSIDTDRLFEYALRFSIPSHTMTRTPKVMIQTLTEKRLINVEDILWGQQETLTIAPAHSATAIYLRDNRMSPIFSTRTVGQITDRYNSIGLCRIRRDAFVNLAHVDWIRSEGKSLFVSLKGEQQLLLITASYRTQFYDMLDRFL